MKNKRFGTNNFYVLAEKYRLEAIDESIIRERDETRLFYEELELHITKRELINININAKVRLGKSTVGIKLGKEIFKLLLKHKKRNGGRFGVWNIARDEDEYSTKMMDPKTTNTVIVTDEYDDLEHTGENVTAEMALNQNFSKIQAMRYVHRICCSPRDTVDQGSDIHLSIIAADHETMTTRCLLYYRYYQGGVEHTRLLGYVDIYVGDIIKKWKEIEDIFIKEKRTKEEEELIKKMRKEDWYVEYMIKKRDKINLISEERIFRPRELKYAGIILSVVEKLEPLAKMGNLIDLNIAKNYVETAYRREGRVVTVIGTDLASKRVMGHIALIKAFWKITKDIKKLDEQGKLAEVEELMKVQNELAIGMAEAKKELKHYKKIAEKYYSIESGETA